MADGKPQSGAFADLFGGKERVKNTFYILRADTGAVIGNTDYYVLVVLAGLDNYLGVLFQSQEKLCVDNNIYKNLLNLEEVQHHPGQIRIKLSDAADVINPVVMFA